MNEEQIQEAIESCDERYVKIGCKLMDFHIYGKMTKNPIAERVRYFENSLNLVRVEKLIYNALLINNRGLLPLCLAKYDELIGESFEIGKSMVVKENCKEEFYLQYCKDVMGQREYIKTLCE
jgi:hypothetical protein